MIQLKRTALVTTIVLLLIGCDQITKMVATDYLASSPPVSFLGDVFRLQYSTNAGAFLSLGSNLSASQRFWIFVVTTGIVLAVMLIVVLLHRGLRPVQVVGVCLIIGGGISNLIDRAFSDGAVIDFMNIGVGSLRTGIFNVADLAIMIGAGMLMFPSLFHKSA